MLAYIDPDNTIFTQNSTRQDKGRLEYTDKYFYQYLILCSSKVNFVFDGAANGQSVPDYGQWINDKIMKTSSTRMGMRLVKG